LRQNAGWFCTLRWLVIAVLATAAAVGFFPEGLTHLGLRMSPWWPLGAALFLASTNLAFVWWIQGHREGHGVSVRWLLWAQIVSDLLVLTGVIHWLGHELPAAPFMYLFHVILACIVFVPCESLAVAGLAAAFYLISLGLESAGVLPRSSVVAGSAGESAGPGAIPWVHVISMLLIWTVIWYLVSRLASAFRSRDHELFINNRRLKASIEERSKHMLQTTHQLKAPFAAIHAQSQLLLGDYCGRLPPLARVTVEKMSDRCLVLARQIQEMLQLANLRSQGQTPPPRQPVNLQALIEEIVARVEPSARHRGVRLEKQLEPITVEAVADHLTMLMDNLVVNAVNYSRENGRVTVTCRGQPPGDAIVIVRDEGIGIPREKLGRIFDDYFRTEEAVRHNRGSTGLGLAIVRQVACKDRVPITVESAPGWGTRFTVTLPRVLTPFSENSNLNN
jgi:signal transduction histidine kinase